MMEFDEEQETQQHLSPASSASGIGHSGKITGNGK
jgi:hypothetical protein